MEIFRQKEETEFINELIALYPFLSYEESKEIIENMADYWEFIIKNN